MREHSEDIPFAANKLAAGSAADGGGVLAISATFALSVMVLGVVETGEFAGNLRCINFSI
jgi:hypothetical protein